MPYSVNQLRVENGLPLDQTVFVSFNRVVKVAFPSLPLKRESVPQLDRATFAIWIRILKHVPGSVLWCVPKSQDTPFPPKKIKPDFYDL